MKLSNLAILLVALMVGLAAAASGATVSARGKVVDTNGNPVADVKVYAVDWQHSDNHGVHTFISSLKAATLSNADGTFEFSSLPKPQKSGGYVLVGFVPDKYLGWTRGEGELMADGWWWGMEPEDGYTITVAKPGIYEGKVIDEDGKPIAGATVNPVQLGGCRMEHISAAVKLNPAITDAKGVFRLTGIPKGNKVGPTVEAPGCAYNEYTDWDKTTVTMKPGGDITGRVVDEHGKPIENANVSASSADRRVYRNVLTDKDGIYTITGMPVGKCSIGALVKNGIIKRPADLAIAAGKVTKAPDMIAINGVIMSGRVIDGETCKPIADAKIYTIDASDPKKVKWWSRDAVTDENGIYKARVLPGDVKIQNVWAKTYLGKPYVSEKINVPSSGKTGVVIRLAKADVMRGTCVDESGKPVARAVVDYPRSSSGIATDTAGNFVLYLPEDGCDTGG